MEYSHALFVRDDMALCWLLVVWSAFERKGKGEWRGGDEGGYDDCKELQ